MSKKYRERIVLNIIEDDAQQEEDAGEYLSEKFEFNQEVVFERNELIPVRVPAPTTLDIAMSNKVVISSAVKAIAPVSTDSILYIIGHSDAESKRLSGLKMEDWAEILGSTGNFREVKRIHIVGCHSAGEVQSAEQALATRGTLSYAVTGFFSFAGLLHEQLKRYGITTEVAAYCSYVRIAPNGEIRTGFDEHGQRARHTPATKVIFSWGDESSRSMTFSRYD